MQRIHHQNPLSKRTQTTMIRARIGNLLKPIPTVITDDEAKRLDERVEDLRRQRKLVDGGILKSYQLRKLLEETYRDSIAARMQQFGDIFRSVAKIEQVRKVAAPVL